MKKCLLIAGIAVLSTSAYATTTRLKALGQDTSRGSFYIDDNYNVFRNAAYVNMYKNYIVTEWGASNGATSGGEQLEGGFFREMGNFTYGVYFNNESDTGEGIARGVADPISKTLTGSDFVDNTFKTSNNAIDLFFGGDMGVQWGARIQYTKSDDQVAEADATNVGNAYTTEHSAMNISLGMMMGDLAAYANIGLKNEYVGAASDADANADEDKLEGTGAINLGVNYKMGNMRVFADYDKGGQEYTNGTDTSFKKEWEGSTINVGVGHTHEVSSTARVYSEIKYYSQTREITNLTASGDNWEYKVTKLPITVGFEADANSWLTLRGSITQNLPFMDSTELTDADTAANNEEDTSASSTAFAAGATLNFGKLRVDGVIGNGETGGNSDELTTDVLFAKTAVTYNF